jgi:hypothetical protein
MAAAVVYDGAGSGGTLFAGKKFWIAQRVPSRTRWLELITVCESFATLRIKS